MLGTQVPVDVRHNATLLMRFFVYIREALAGREPHGTLLQAWHRTLSGNPVNDVLQGNVRLMDWAREPIRAGVVLTEFMQHYSRRRLHGGSVYRDTELVLMEMAKEMGRADHVRTWLRTPGYLPESAMYGFYGKPDRIHLNSGPILGAVRP